jgi:hypothetical protein
MSGTAHSYLLTRILGGIRAFAEEHQLKTAAKSCTDDLVLVLHGAFVA